MSFVQKLPNKAARVFLVLAISFSTVFCAGFFNQGQADPVTKNDYEFTLSFSRDSISDQATQQAMTVSVDWKALNGINAGDTFSVNLPDNGVTDPDANIALSVWFANSGETLTIEKDGTVYGTAAVVNESTGSKIVFTFTNSSTELNISGNVTFNAYMGLTIIDTTKPHETEVIYEANIEGESVEFPIEITPPNWAYYDKPLRKEGSQGSALIAKDDPVAEGVPFYQFTWRVRVNETGLADVSGIPGGKAMHDAVITDELQGPGHYIDITDTNYFRIHYKTNMTSYAPVNQASILSSYPNPSGRTWIPLSTFLTYAGTDKISYIPYGDGNPNHIKGFTLHLGDLDGGAFEVEYRSVIAEGSDTTIPSYRDYFYQSVMTADGGSNVYKNTVSLKSTEYVPDSITQPTYSSEGSSTMVSGNTNIRIIKVNERGEPQQGVAFTLWWGSGSSLTKTTNSDGMVEFDQMGLGLYKLEESQALTDYTPIDPILFKIPATVPSKYESGYIDLTDTATFESSGGLQDITLKTTFDPALNETIDVNEITNFPTARIPANGAITFSGKKTLENKALEADMFEFELYNKDTSQLLETVKNKADGSYSFSSLNYTDLQAGTYHYTIQEKNTGLPDITYSETAYDITVVVLDNGDGTMTITADTAVDKLNFTNKYTDPGDPGDPDTPKELPKLASTGDESPLGTVGIFFTGLALATLALSLKRMRATSLK